jgi:nicotinic acid mononucleotide adenylyltransferase
VLNKEQNKIKHILKEYQIPKAGVDLKEAAAFCAPFMEQLCGGDSPEDWVMYSYEYLRAAYFPENFQVEGYEKRGSAVRFYIQVLNELFDREKRELPFDPLRDFALLKEQEEKYTRILTEYRRMRHCIREDGVYAFMRLSRICTPYNTLGHIAGVHHVAMYMARQLKETKVPIDLGLMSGAAFMHDMGKFGCRPEEGRRVPYLHYYYTYQYCSANDLGGIGDIASNHSVWDLELENLSAESLLLIYADFRVKSIYDEQKREQVCFWSLDEAYQVILDKLDNVDEAKQRRYARVYARLKDFEDYLIHLGCHVDLTSGFGNPEPENYAEVMTPTELVQKLKALAIQSNLTIMEKTTREEQFIEFLEHIRSQRDSRQVRAYLTAIEEYSAYLPQNQKKTILRFLLDMLSHRDGDVRRQAASIAGILIARYEICFTKEVPQGFLPPAVGERQEDCFREFLKGILSPDVQASEQERRHAGYAMKTVLQTLLREIEEKRHRTIIQIYLEQCRKDQDELTAFFLLDTAAQIRPEQCTEEQQEILEDFTLYFLVGHGQENQVASLWLMLLWMRQGWRSRCNLSELLARKIPQMKQQPYCIQFLAARIREFYGIPSEVGMIYYEMTNLYTENQRAEVPWIFKYVNLEILRQRQGIDRSPEQMYQYASHLLNMLQFSGRIVNRLQAGQNLLEILPVLPRTQKYEIVLELVRALEIGEYAVSKYIPPYLGKIFHMLEENEQFYVLEQLEYLMQSQEKRTILATLETAGAILKSAPMHMKRGDQERLTGILCSGMASENMEIAQEAFYIAGHDLFSDNCLSLEQKAGYFTLLARKILSLLNWEKLDVYVYFNGAALNHIYRFIDDYLLTCKELPLKETKKPLTFFPGTFDPFSLGHKQIVQEIVQMGYRVYLAVDEFSWSKRTQPFEVRRRILAMSVADLREVYLFPEELPVNIANPEDLKLLASTLGGEKPYIVVGSDVVRNASAYRKRQEENSIHSFPHLIFYRNQKSEEEERYIRQSICAECRFMQIPAVYEEVSSTKIRENVNAGRDISGLVDPKVQNYIYRQGLYSMDSVYKKTARYTEVEVQIEDEKQGGSVQLYYTDREVAEVRFHRLDPWNLLQECANMEQADAIRNAVSGNVVWIDRIDGNYSQQDDRRLTVLNEALEYFQEQSCSYALCRPEEEQRKILALHGFVQLEQLPEVYLVDLHSPLVVFYDTPALLKESIADTDEVHRQIRRSHIRLLDVMSKLYPGRLLLCFESSFLNYRLLRQITQKNGVSMDPDPKRQLGEKMCVPFGKILKGVRVPNTVTKELETEKLYKKDLSAFSITNYRGYASLDIQMRTIHSFGRPVMMVDDLFHTGKRMKELSMHLEREKIQDHRLIVGVLSGRGRDLARLRGLKIQAVYSVPNLHSWVIESDLYPFFGGDGVEQSNPDQESGELCPSMNPILPYAMPTFLEGISQQMIYEFSKVCMENAIDIYRAVEGEYRKQYGRRLSLDRISEILVQPRYPDQIGLDESKRMMTPSQILNEELKRLERFR